MKMPQVLPQSNHKQHENQTNTSTNCEYTHSQTDSNFNSQLELWLCLSWLVCPRLYFPREWDALRVLWHMSTTRRPSA